MALAAVGGADVAAGDEALGGVERAGAEGRAVGRVARDRRTRGAGWFHCRHRFGPLPSLLNGATPRECRPPRTPRRLPGVTTPSCRAPELATVRARLPRVASSRGGLAGWSPGAR